MSWKFFDQDAIYRCCRMSGRDRGKSLTSSPRFASTSESSL
jgi:hypothetical protein